jgi:hypothetical protein
MTDNQTQENPLDKMPIDLNFTVKDVNAILEALANLPFAVSAPLIKMVQEQGIPQVKKHEEALANLQSVVTDVEVKESV